MTYKHNNHGDLEQRVDGGKKLSLTYDELGNLAKAIVEDGTAKTTLEYVIDGMGRRVARRTNGAVDRIWLYRDGLRPVSEVDGNGVFTHFVYDSTSAESGAPVALIRAGVFYRVVKDHLGSVRMVVNAQTGVVAQSIDYDAYGRVLSETGAGFQPFGFAGGLYDATTQLVRFGARDYDPSIGRWTNKDPIGFAGQQGNVYLYVDGDPVNRVDPTGLESFMCTKPLTLFDGIAVRLGGGTKQVNNTRSGADIDGNVLYHQYICVSRSGEKDVCGGQSGGGKMLGPGEPSHDSYLLYRCERQHDDNQCLDSCLASAINSKERPYYSVFFLGGTNCQEWADETMARCEQQCGLK